MVEARRRNRIVLSYAQADRVIVQRLVGRLQEEGVDVSFAQWELDDGEAISTRLKALVGAGDVLVVVLSPASVASPWVRYEIAQASNPELRDRAVAIVPVLIADCEVPEGLSERVILDLRQDDDDGIERLAQRLVDASNMDLASLEPSRFEALVSDFLESEGYGTKEGDGTDDFGLDFVLKNGAAPDRGEVAASVLVQVKQYRQSRVGLSSLHQFADLLEHLGPGHVGLLVTSGHLTSVTRNWLEQARAMGRRIEVIDGTELRTRLLGHADLLARYFGGKS